MRCTMRCTSNTKMGHGALGEVYCSIFQVFQTQRVAVKVLPRDSSRTSETFYLLCGGTGARTY